MTISLELLAIVVAVTAAIGGASELDEKLLTEPRTTRLSLIGRADEAAETRHCSAF